MAVTCQVKFVQGVTVGTPGIALFGSPGVSVQVSNGASNAGVAVWTFTVVSVPHGSSVPLGVAQTGATPTWNFTPDMAGCFIVLVTVSDGNPVPSTASDARAFGVLSPSGNFIPSFTGDNNSLNFGGQTTGWDVYMEAWLQALELLIDAGASGTPVRKTANFTVSPGGIYTCNAGITATVPAMANGQKFKIIDYQQASATGGPPSWSSQITITPPGGWQITDPNTGLYASIGASVGFHVNGGVVEWASDGTSKIYINA